VNAPLALFLFIGYSCWHFGEADGKQWGFSSIISFLWGITVLLYILTSHAPETNSITNSIADITFSWKFPEWIFLPFFLFSIFKKQYSNNNYFMAIDFKPHSFTIGFWYLFYWTA